VLDWRHRRERCCAPWHFANPMVDRAVSRDKLRFDSVTPGVGKIDDGSLT
jgi:hypothetical protein